MAMSRSRDIARSAQTCSFRRCASHSSPKLCNCCNHWQSSTSDLRALTRRTLLASTSHTSKPRLQKLIQRYPVHPRRFERSGVDAARAQPIGNSHQVLGVRPEFAHRMPVFADPVRGHRRIVAPPADVNSGGVGVLDAQRLDRRAVSPALGRVNSLRRAISLSECHSRTWACRYAQSLNRDVRLPRLWQAPTRQKTHHTRRRCLNHTQRTGSMAPVLSRSLSESNTRNATTPQPCFLPTPFDLRANILLRPNGEDGFTNAFNCSTHARTLAQPLARVPCCCRERLAR